MAKLSVVVGGQLGSEGKGAVTAYLSSREQNQRNDTQGNQGNQYDVIAVRVAGPNAGHTVIGRCPPSCTSQDELDHHPMNHPWRLRSVPVAAVSNPDAQLIIAAGSEIEPEVLREEIDELDAAGYDASRRLIIDVHATILEDKHKQLEQAIGLTERLGSTAKGIGAARSARVMRDAVLVRNTPNGFLPGDRIDTAQYLQSMLNDPNTHILIEGTQGYGLGLHTQFYPYTTSSDCRAIDFLAMAGISPWVRDDVDFRVWVVFRTSPIRVAGNSGPLEGETTWEQLGQTPELTTVTKKVRRVGSWDPLLARKAVRANGGGSYLEEDGPIHVALTMVDYEIPGVKGMDSGTGYSMSPQDNADLDLLIKRREADLRAPVMLIGTGPDSIIDLRIED